MLKKTLGPGRWDRLGMFLSVGCALHCLVLSIVPWLFLKECSGCCHGSEGWTFHTLILPVVAGTAVFAFSGRHGGRGASNVARLLAGLALLWSPHMTASLLPYETLLTVAGAFLIGWAHWANLRACKGCR